MDLSAHPKWRGMVTEIGMIFLEDKNTTVGVNAMQIGPRSKLDMAELTWADWASMSKWSQKSVHYTPAGAETTPLKLPLLVAAWLSLSLLLSILLIRFAPLPQLGVAVCAVIGWLILDLRWTTNLIGQTHATHAYYSRDTGAYLDMAPDHVLFNLSNDTRSFLGKANGPTLVISEAPYRDFDALRMKYHLLPAPVLVRKGAHLRNAPKVSLQNVLITRNPYLPPGESPLTAGQLTQDINAVLKASFEVVLDTDDGVLLTAQ